MVSSPGFVQKLKADMSLKWPFVNDLHDHLVGETAGPPVQDVTNGQHI